MKIILTITVYLLIFMLPKITIAAPYTIEVSQLDFSDFLPITGSCEMDLTAQVTDLPGSQMCLSSDNATIAHYRIIAPTNSDFNIQVNTRTPVNSDGLTFTPIGKLTSDVDDIDIIPGQVQVVNSGLTGRIDIKFGGQIIISNTLSPGLSYYFEMVDLISWSQVP